MGPFHRLSRDLLLAGLVLFAAAVGLDALFANARTPVDAVLGPIAAGSEPFTLLILGNSHAGALGQAGLRPDDVTANASLGGQDLYRGAHILRSLLPRLPHLREVLVSVDYDAIGYNLSEFGQNWQDPQYAQYTGRLYHDGVLARWLASSAFFRVNRDLGALRSVPPPPVLPFDSSATPEGCRERAREHSEVKFRSDLIAENQGFLREIVDLCRVWLLDLHVVNLPKASCYVESYAPRTRAAGSAAIRSALAGREDLFYDYFADPRFGSGDFLDYDHLSPTGARKVLADLAAHAPAPRPHHYGGPSRDAEDPSPDGQPQR